LDSSNRVVNHRDAIFLKESVVIVSPTRFVLLGDLTMQYECQNCGHIYDPEVGDPEGGIEPGTPFSEISEDWICPVCGAEKSQFEPLE
jgi:rubredoxin